MKKILFSKVAVIIFAALAVSGCASAPKTQANSGTVPAASKHVEREIIDWKGAAINSPIPAWVESAIDGDKAAFLRMPEFEGKMVFIADRRGKNENALKSWVHNVDVKGGMSKALSDFVIAKFGSEASGSPDEEAEWQSFMEEMTSTFSKMEINGMIREKDYWVEQRIWDKDAKSSEDLFTYVVVYSIDISIFQEQLDIALGRVEAKNAKQAEAKEKVETGILEAQAFGESIR